MNYTYIVFLFIALSAVSPVALYLLSRRNTRRAIAIAKAGSDDYRARCSERVAARQASLDADPRTRGLVASEVVAKSLNGTVTRGIGVSRGDRPLADLVDYHTRSS